LRTGELTDLSKFYLWIFLHSEYGKKSLLRTASQTGQPHLTIEPLYELQIPKFSKAFQDRFEELHLRIKNKQIESQKAYDEAEQILLSEVRLLDWKPGRRLYFVKNFSETESVARIDADYFQPMYDELAEKIKEYKNGYKSLSECVRIKDKNFVPKAEESYKYIELANISANGIINGFMEAIGEELPSRARRKVNTGDVIVSSIEGSLSSIALINDDLNNALCSTGFYVIDSDIINSETLLVLLKSPVGQLQLKKGCSGTILTAINNEEFKRILIPDVADDVQEEIKKKISEMYQTKSASKKLLDIAKRAVEMAIEQNEEEAEKWLNNEVNHASSSIHLESR
jgi:restriction endonuclease S subunit